MARLRNYWYAISFVAAKLLAKAIEVTCIDHPAAHLSCNQSRFAYGVEDSRVIVSIFQFINFFSRNPYSVLRPVSSAVAVCSLEVQSKRASSEDCFLEKSATCDRVRLTMTELSIETWTKLGRLIK